MIPVEFPESNLLYYVGFQVDMVEQPNAILDKMMSTF